MVLVESGVTSSPNIIDLPDVAKGMLRGWLRVVLDGCMTKHGSDQKNYTIIIAKFSSIFTRLTDKIENLVKTIQ